MELGIENICAKKNGPAVQEMSFNPLPHRDPFITFANRADQDQAALVRAVGSGSSLFPKHGHTIPLGAKRHKTASHCFFH